MTGAAALLPAFVIGAANAAHCAGMCGVFALRTGGAGRFALYALGKTATYVALGTLAGAAGAQAVRAIGGAQAWLACLAGAVLVVAGVRLLLPRTASGSSAWATLLAPFSELASRARAAGGPLLFGAATGAIPCGVTYLAAAHAAATASPAWGAASMASFGLGTVPVLLVTALAGRGVLLRLGPARVRAVGAVLVLAAGLVTMVRAGLPLLADPPGDAVPCCH